MKCVVALALFLAAPAAFAHPGHGATGLIAGLVHPLLGIDHLLALVGAGLWAVQLGGSARWWVPGGFIAALGLGCALALTGVPMAGVEPGIAASVVVFGLLLSSAAVLSPALGAALAGGFALLHGYAHGAELPGAGQALGYVAGLIAASATVLGLSMALGAGVNRAGRPVWLRTVGMSMVAGGTVLLTGL